MNTALILTLLNQVGTYFKKNKGLNTVTAAVAPLLAVQAFNSDATAIALADNRVGIYVAIFIVISRVALAAYRIHKGVADETTI